MNSNLSQDNIHDLQALTCEGNTALLPTEQLRDYASMKKLLMNATGKYSKGKFTFDYPADAIVAGLLNGEFTNLKKVLQFFPTPSELADTLVDQLMWPREGAKALEPSAGQGAIANALIRRFGSSVPIDMVEISKFNCAILERQFPGDQFKITSGDFLEMNSVGGGYDVIVANPPFTKNADIDHVMHMYDCLAKEGQLISIMSTSWIEGSQKKQVAFREWIEENGSYERNGQGAFKSSGTMVDSCLVKIYK